VLMGIVVLNVPVLLLRGRPLFTPTSEYINRLYYLPAISALAVCTAVGWSAALDRLFRSRKSASASLLARALVLSSALFPFALNWNACDRSEYWIAREYAQNLVKSLPNDGAVFPLTNNEGFLLTYKRFVEKDPSAWLLDERFGWDGKRLPNAIYTAWDAGKSAAFPLGQIRSEFSEVETVPESILYRVIQEPERKGLSRFERIREVDYKIEHRPSDFPAMSPFERMIFASYSAYYAGLGAKRFQEGREELAEGAWRLAEELNPPDSYCCFLLGSIYEETGVRPRNEIRDWYEKSLALFDLCYDPLDTRFYAISKETAEERLDALPR
jgi:tetratricopeptide (TPR) repeat protein